MGCWMTMRTSTASPRRALGGTWILAVIALAPVQAGQFVHGHVDGIEPEAAVGELRDRRNALRAVQPQARLDLRAAVVRAHEEGRHARYRVLVCDELDPAHVIRLAHRAVHLHG